MHRCVHTYAYNHKYKSYIHTYIHSSRSYQITTNTYKPTYKDMHNMYINYESYTQTYTHTYSTFQMSSASRQISCTCPSCGSRTFTTCNCTGTHTGQTRVHVCVATQTSLPLALHCARTRMLKERTSRLHAARCRGLWLFESRCCDQVFLIDHLNHQSILITPHLHSLFQAQSTYYHAKHACDSCTVGLHASAVTVYVKLRQ
jgi:hypothetical protein